MIQRIQTIYLLIVSILMVVMMSFPVGYFFTDSTVMEMTNLSVTLKDGTIDYTPWALCVIVVVVAALSLVAVFLFKRRMVQIRLALFSSIVLIGYYATLAFFVYASFRELGEFSYSWTVSLPLVAVILNWLAIRAIGKDEMLVKAYERLR